MSYLIQLGFPFRTGCLLAQIIVKIFNNLPISVSNLQASSQEHARLSKGDATRKQWSSSRKAYIDTD